MIIIHDSRVPGEYLAAILEEVPEAVLAPFRGLEGVIYKSIESHPDIYFFQADEKTLIHAPGAPRKLLSGLKERGIRLLKGDKDPGQEYPETARYNAARIGGFLFHNTEYTDPVILEYAREKGLKPVNVSQAYTRCSILQVGEDSIITQDVNIAEAASGEGLKVLLLSPGSIILPGEKCGFIGGAGGYIGDGRGILLGDIKLHPEGGKIEKFLEERSVSYIMAKNMPLYDGGALMIFS